MRKLPSTKVMEIFSEAAAAMPPAELDAYLDRACHGDPGLREEVESLLQTQQRLPAFLDAPTVSEGIVVDAGEADVGIDALSIDQGRAHVGRYAILERIG